MTILTIERARAPQRRAQPSKADATIKSFLANTLFLMCTGVLMFHQSRMLLPWAIIRPLKSTGEFSFIPKEAIKVVSSAGCRTALASGIPDG